MPANFRAPGFATIYQAKGETVELEESAKKSLTLTLIPDDDN
jgi:hypothetical protein